LGCNFLRPFVVTHQLRRAAEQVTLHFVAVEIAQDF